MATGKKNKGPSLNEDVSQLEAEYVRERPRADRLVTCVKDEVTDLLARGDIALGVPVEARVKDWASIKEKIESKVSLRKAITDLADLVGIRLYFCFEEISIR